MLVGALLLLCPVGTTPTNVFLDTHCTSCHSVPTPDGDLDLELLMAGDDSIDALFKWDRVRARLSARDMPPRADRRPEPKAYDEALIHVNVVIDRIARHHDDPGSPAGRRLNRTEWRNAVHDLLGVDIDVSNRLPVDEIGHGFDTVGDTLGLSPAMLEKFLDAAELAAMRAVQHPDNPVLNRWTTDVDGLRIVGRARKTRGTVHMPSRATVATSAVLPRDGRYRIRVIAHGRQAGDEPVRLAVRADGVRLGVVNVPETAPAPHDLEVDLPEGPVKVDVTFINDMYRPDHPDPSERDRNAAVDGIHIEGPLDEPVYSEFQATLETPGDAADSLRILREAVVRLLPRAWRRDVTDTEIDAVVDLAASIADTHEDRLRAAIVTTLVHPAFLLRLEADPGPTAHERRLTNDEIATRMSLMLWSSLPDDELRRAARTGELATTSGRRNQLQRMLADPRSNALSENFASQWLQVRRLDAASPDPRQFPGVDRDMLDSMQREPVALFDRVLRQGGSWRELLTSDLTSVDERLAGHYGLDAAGETRRGTGTGILEHAAILTATSNPTRTSPVKRGKWVLEVLLDAPPAPPPPDIAPIPEDGRDLEPGSLRALIVQHREDPSCRTCHERMDELGFAFESFDAVGRPRQGVDDTGRPPGDDPIQGTRGLRDWVLARDALPRSLARHMLTYAIGRGFDVRDEAAIDAVAETLIRQDRLSALIEAVVESRPFLYRGNPRSHADVRP